MSLEEEEMNYLQGIFDAFEAGPEECNDWERGFMTDNATRFNQYGAETHLSEKQWAIIRKVGDIYKIHEPGSEAEKISEQANAMLKPTDVDDDEVPF